MSREVLDLICTQYTCACMYIYEMALSDAKDLVETMVNEGETHAQSVKS